MENALIIFARNPVYGKVKTRIAASIGNGSALSVYKRLLTHTFDITNPLPLDKFLFYDEEITDKDRWSTGSYVKMLQDGNDLGNRMENAFRQLFQQHYSKICIIGSDCAELTGAHINKAFDALNDHDLVIGPANDGGYYLVGMKQGFKNIFSGIPWSTDMVFKKTLALAHEMGYSTAFLPQLNDVDTIENIPAGWIDDFPENNA